MWLLAMKKLAVETGREYVGNGPCTSINRGPDTCPLNISNPWMRHRQIATKISSPPVVRNHAITVEVPNATRRKFRIGDVLLGEIKGMPASNCVVGFCLVYPRSKGAKVGMLVGSEVAVCQAIIGRKASIEVKFKRGQ